jgi:hypothetical protein
LVIGLPLISGIFLDRTAGLGADAYRFIFLAAAMLLGVTWICAWRTNFAPRLETAPCLPFDDGES